MMTNTIIPLSIRKIIDVYIKSNFRPFTYKELSKRLRIADPNTLVQRINRNPEYFEFRGERPKIIELKKDVKEIIFYRDNNTCRICQKAFDLTDLSVRYKDPYLKDKDREDWDNIITACSNCKNVNLTRKVNAKEKLTYLSTGNHLWEYKEIHIREISKLIDPYMSLYPSEGTASSSEYAYFFEFNEDDNQEWFHVTDEGNKRSNKLSDILDYFGYQGWELILMKEHRSDYDSDMIEDYHCIFKRKRNGEANLNDSTK